MAKKRTKCKKVAVRLQESDSCINVVESELHGSKVEGVVDQASVLSCLPPIMITRAATTVTVAGRA
jgi:hypothetical protein